MQYEVSDTLWMACGVCYGDYASTRHSEQGKLLNTGRVDHRFKIFNVFVQCELNFAIGQAAATRVIIYEGALVGKHRKPMPPHWILPIQVEVTHPMCSTNKRRARAADCIRNANAV